MAVSFHRLRPQIPPLTALGWDMYRPRYAHGPRRSPLPVSLPLSAHRATLPARTSPEPLWPHAIHDARRLCTHKTFCALPAAPQESADRAPRASESVA